MGSQGDRLRVGAAVLGAVAVLVVVGRFTSPEAPGSRSAPTPTATRTPAPRSTPPSRWATAPTARPAAQVDVGRGGGPLVFGAGSLWAGAWPDREVVRVDPRSTRVVARFPAGQSPAGLAVGAGTVWVTQPDTDQVVRLDPATGQVVATIGLGRLPFEVARGDRRFVPLLVAVGAGAGWVATARGALARIDPASNRVVAVLKLPPKGPAGIAVAGRSVWVAAGSHGVAQIDTATNRLRRTIRLKIDAERIAAGGEAVWVAGRSTDPSFEPAGAIARIDAATGRVQTVIPSGLPTGLAAGPGAVWVTVRGADDAAGGLGCIRPGTSPVGMTVQPALGELAGGGRAVWAADRRGSRVYRIDPGVLC
jgi:glutamine cyclotransferase